MAPPLATRGALAGAAPAISIENPATLGGDGISEASDQDQKPMTSVPLTARGAPIWTLVIADCWSCAVVVDPPA